MKTDSLGNVFYDICHPKVFEKNFEKTKSASVFSRLKEKDDEISIKGIKFDAKEFTEDIYLKTAFDDLELFLTENGISKNGYPITIKTNKGFVKEEYEIKIEKNGASITVGEREGLRRAIIKIEDMLLSNGGNLKIGVYHCKYVLERRISRCFFSPINRSPNYIDELYDDNDYYPHGFLNRLMHDGINAVWISSEFRSLIESPYITEFGEGREKRVKKLKGVIERCALYGIEVFLFMIEPMSLYEPAVLHKYPDIYKKYPQAHGNNGGGPIAFCTYSEFGEKYLADSVERGFTDVSEIAGIISITYGERVTSCANTWGEANGEWYNNCPYCKDKSLSEIVAHTVDIIVKSMKKVKPDAEFISWTYAHRGKPLNVIDEYVEKVPKEAILMQNFEDDGRVFQLEKKRFALDYYLCYAGPSDMFTFTAKLANDREKKLYAKMQICCSHELASMPYIPVPGLIYDKITRAKSLGVKGVMESWYFGNYPCFMSKAVDILGTETDYADKNDFLFSLARLYYQPKNIDIAVKSWQLFEKAYRKYPINVMFNYYGPMHDGVVWELSLIPKNKSLPRSWQLQDEPVGDRIGECLFLGHSLEEAELLIGELNKDWQRGVSVLSEMKDPTERESEQLAVARALEILFKSGLNILKFYRLRDYLGYEKGDSMEILSEMKKIVLSEIENSEEIIPLCQKYNTFGYHSEAEGYKFTPERIEKRNESLKKLLNVEFAKTKARIKKGLSPLAFYTGEEIQSVCYTVGRNGLESAVWQDFNNSVAKFRVCENKKEILIELYSDKKTGFFMSSEFRLTFPEPTLVISSDGKISLHRDAKTHQSALEENAIEYLSAFDCERVGKEENTHLIVRINKEKSKFIRFPYKMMLRATVGGDWVIDENPVRTLGKSTISAGDFGWLK